MAKRTSPKTVHMINLVSGGPALASYYIFNNNPDLLIISELGIGFAWSSMLAMPFVILAVSLPPEKMGV